MEAAGQFVQKLAPNDLVALVTLPAGVTVDFTADRVAIKSALIKIVGGGANRYLSNTNISLAESFAFMTKNQYRLWDEAVRMECNWARDQNELRELPVDARSRRPCQVPHSEGSREMSERSLEVLVRRLSIIDGQKHVIFIGQGLVTGSSFGYLDGVADLKWLGDLVQAARVNFYVLHIDSAFLEAFDVRERLAVSNAFRGRAAAQRRPRCRSLGRRRGVFQPLDVTRPHVRTDRARNVGILRGDVRTRGGRPRREVAQRRRQGGAVGRDGQGAQAVHRGPVSPDGSGRARACRAPSIRPYLPASIPMDLTTYVVGTPRTGVFACCSRRK